MKQLKQLSHSRLTTSQLQFFSLQSMGLIAPLLKKSDFLSRQHDELKGSTDAIESLSGISRKQDITEDLSGSDTLQDQILIAIRDTCKAKAATEWFNKAGAEAGVVVLTIMNEYGKDLIYGNYEQQSVAIPSFIAKMALIENVEFAQKSGIANFLTALTPAHASFVDLYNQKLTETAVPMTTILKEKKNLRYRIDGLLTYLDIQIADGVEEFTDVKAPMNLLITEMMSQVRANQTRSENSAG